MQKAETLSADQVLEQLQIPGTEEPADPASDAAADLPGEGAVNGAPAPDEPIDPMKAMLEDAKKDGTK